MSEDFDMVSGTEAGGTLCNTIKKEISTYQSDHPYLGLWVELRVYGKGPPLRLYDTAVFTYAPGEAFDWKVDSENAIRLKHAAVKGRLLEVITRGIHESSRGLLRSKEVVCTPLPHGASIWTFKSADLMARTFTSRHCHQHELTDTTVLRYTGALIIR